MRFNRKKAPNAKAWRRNEKRVEVSILELDSSSKLNSEWQAYWWTKSRAVKRRWLYERIHRGQYAEAKPVAEGKVFSVENVEEVNVGLNFDFFSDGEGFCSAQVHIKEPAAALFNVRTVNYKASPLAVHGNLDTTKRICARRHCMIQSCL